MAFSATSLSRVGILIRRKADASLADRTWSSTWIGLHDLFSSLDRRSRMSSSSSCVCREVNDFFFIVTSVGF